MELEILDCFVRATRPVAALRAMTGGPANTIALMYVNYTENARGAVASAAKGRQPIAEAASASAD